MGDRVADEPEIGSIIYLGMTRYQVMHYVQDEATGGTLVVEPAQTVSIV